MSEVKVAMFSFADIDNYGDILFSHIFRNEIAERIPGVKIDFYTPSDCEIEGVQYMGYTREKIDNKYDALILAGGEVVHLFDERTWNPIYEKRGLKVLTGKASDVVWDWNDCNDCNAGFKAWLSVGVRPFEDKWDDDKINSTIDHLDYISTRGILSKKILEKNQYNYYNNKIDITPDLGWLFPKFLKSQNKYGKLYGDYIQDEDKYAIFQFHNITDEEANDIARDLLTFQEEHKIQVYLLPVIHLWEDHKYMQKIIDVSKGKLQMLPTNLTTLEIADIILNAEIVLSASLHVAITALADGIPAAIYNKWNGTKLQDLFGLQMRLDFLIDKHSDIDITIKSLLLEKKRNDLLMHYKNFMQTKLKGTFDMLAFKIKKNV